MKRVREILNDKGAQVWSIAPDRTVFDALKLMGEKEIGALTVVDANTLVGIISERDYARKVILKGKTSRETLIHEIMSRGVISATPDQTVQECLSIMTERRIRHLPVLAAGQLVGIVSIGDLVKALIAEQQFMIAQLESYITQTPAAPIASVI